MKLLVYLLLSLFFCISINAQTTAIDSIEPYDYDKILKNGYEISFKVDDSLQYLYLKKGRKIITELSFTSRGMPYKNLGYVGADFKNYFVFVHSFGSGNPKYIELIKKSNGKNILKSGSAWIDVERKQDYLLYCENDVPNEKDKMILYNIKTGQMQFFEFPNEIFNEPEILNRIQISKLTEKELIIKYDTEDGSKLKKYSR